MTGLKRILRSRRGFTLVELVVVLVILGVLSTVTVPALTGYIDNGKEKQAISETQACVETTTRIAAQKYAEWQQKVVNASIGPATTTPDDLEGWVSTDTAAPAVNGGVVSLREGSGLYWLKVENPTTYPATEAYTQVAQEANVTGTVSSILCNQAGQVLYLVYTSKDNIQVVYTNDGTTASVDTNDKPVVVPTPQPTTVPVPTVNPDVTPEPTTEPTATPLPTQKPTLPDNAAGFLTINYHDVDGVTGLDGLKVRIIIQNTDTVVFSGETENGGCLYVPIYNESFGNSVVTANNHKVTYVLQVESKDGRQEIFDTFFQTLGTYENGVLISYSLVVYNDTNNSQYYKPSAYGDENKSYTIYNAAAKPISIRIQDEFGNAISGIPVALKTGEYGSTIEEYTSGSQPHMMNVRLHNNDGVSTPYLDVANYSRNLYVKLDVPSKYVAPNNGSGAMTFQVNMALDADSGGMGAASVTCNETPNVTVGDNSIIITLPLQQVITFHKYARDDQTKELRDAGLTLSRYEDGQYKELSSWTTSDSAQTKTLTSGVYRLEETKTPTNYLTADPIDFTLTNVNGKMKLSSTSSSVNADSYTISMIDPLEIKMVNIWVIDETTGDIWSGAEVEITGDLGARPNQDRKWTSSTYPSSHTFELPLNKGDYVVTVHENNIYGQTKLGFSIDEDGLLSASTKTGYTDGYVQGGNVYIYAKVRFTVAFSGPNGANNVKYAQAKISKGSTTVIEQLDGDEVNDVALPTGTYTLTETRNPSTNKGDKFEKLPDKNITITRNDQGYPYVNGNLSNPWTSTPALKYEYSYKN